MIIDNIQIYNDKDWIYKLNGDNTLLENKLAEQSEIEKKNRIQQLDEKDGQGRALDKELQKIGVSNWFKEGEFYMIQILMIQYVKNI